MTAPPGTATPLHPLRREVREQVLRRRAAVPEAGGRWDLHVRRLRVWYGLHAALHGVDLDVPAGACLAVLGANGAGKTTLLRAIAGTHRPVAGVIRFGPLGAEQLGMTELSRAGVFHVPQGRGVFPGMTVADNLEVMLGGDRDRIEVALSLLPRLGERLSQLAGSLSGGEQQMLAVAPTVAGGHRLLLFDEISMGLAPVIVDELYAVLRTVVSSGTSMIVVEQFAERALDLADRACVLRKGEVVFSGPSAALTDGSVDLRALYMGGDRARP